MKYALKSAILAIWHKLCEIIQDDDGTASTTRVVTVMLAIASIRWINHIVYTTHHLPAPTELLALASFVGFLYGLNRSDNVAAAFKGVSINPDNHPQ